MRKPSLSIPTVESTTNTANVPATPARFGVRSKRAQSISGVPTRVSKRRRTQSQEEVEKKVEQPTCIECKKSNKPDTLIKCTGNCSNKVHRSCLPPQFGKKMEQRYECNDCQRCSICKKGFPDGVKLMKCCLCFTCFHSNCYRPSSGDNIRMIKEKRFSCTSCQSTQKTMAPLSKRNSTADKAVRSRACVVLQTVPEVSDLDSSDGADFLGFNASELPPLPIYRYKSMDNLQSIQSGPNPAHTIRNGIDAPIVANNHHENIIDNNNHIPDATQWTTHQIYEYFRTIFPRHAHVFEDEEIDGCTLYRLQREDVVGRFKLKVGPSIKVYEHILMMQKKRENQIGPNRL